MESACVCSREVSDVILFLSFERMRCTFDAFIRESCATQRPVVGRFDGRFNDVYLLFDESYGICYENDTTHK